MYDQIHYRLQNDSRFADTGIIGFLNKKHIMRIKHATKYNTKKDQSKYTNLPRKYACFKGKMICRVV